jgi:hypothetical protein
MTKQKSTKIDKKAGVIPVGDTGWFLAQVALSPSSKAKVEEIAKQQGISIVEVVTTLFEAKIAMHRELEEEIKRRATEETEKQLEHFKEELTRINEPTEKFNRLVSKLFPHLTQTTDKKTHQLD